MGTEMRVWLLLEGIDLGDRCWGVFTSEQLAKEAIDLIYEDELKRLGSLSLYWYDKWRIESMILDKHHK